jgi:hypothetical protein
MEAIPRWEVEPSFWEPGWAGLPSILDLGFHQMRQATDL